MLPAVGVLYPIYLIFIEFGLLDTKIGLVVVLMLMNLPIIVWMLYTYFKEIPSEILEAARMDGASLRSEILYVLTIIIAVDFLDRELKRFTRICSTTIS